LYFTKTLGPGVCSGDMLSPPDWSTVKEEQFCPFCVIQMPARSHHCARCNSCVARFDHHCPWVDSCVGYRNNHHFFYMCLGATLAHAILVWQCWKYLGTQLENSESTTTFLSEWSILIAFMVFSVLQGFGEAAITVTQLFVAMRDTTSVEHGRRSYDRGVSTNLLQFFHLAGPLQIDYLREANVPHTQHSAQDACCSHDHHHHGV
jgi:hypothetical protein